MTEPNLTARQQKWLNTIQGGLERDTGRSLAEWVALARLCPETGHRARLQWFKDTHGLLQNRATYVLDEAFGDGPQWRDPAALIEALWKDAPARALLAAIDTAVASLPETIRTARKSYTAWSRKVQFAAARPLRAGGAMLGLAVPPATSPRLAAPQNESWSERLKSRLLLATPTDLDDDVRALLKQAWEGA